MKLYLIRHGKTEANERHLYCGSSDLPLSAAGRAALSLHPPLPEKVRFITSGMKRTNETLFRLFGAVSYEVEPRLREIDFGLFELHSYEELCLRADYQQWISGDNMRNVPPGGESGMQMTQRVVAALDDILAAGRDTVVVTHGGVIAAIMEQLVPDSGKSRYDWQPAPGSGFVVTTGASGVEYVPWC